MAGLHPRIDADIIFGKDGIRDRPISPGSPWQNGIAERLIGTLRRECLDQMVTSAARRTYAGFFPPMQRITIKRVRTWHYRKMRR
ncbi:MAG: integrase core domain-containing protein [Limisphaerales bacterium]